MSKKVIKLKDVKILKHPFLAACQQLDNHDKVIRILKTDADMLFRSSIKTKDQLKKICDAITVLIWSNIIAWGTIICLIIALFNHSHNLASLI